jgi:hypothetical protein
MPDKSVHSHVHIYCKYRYIYIDIDVSISTWVCGVCVCVCGCICVRVCLVCMCVCVCLGVCVCVCVCVVQRSNCSCLPESSVLSLISKCSRCFFAAVPNSDWRQNGKCSRCFFAAVPNSDWRQNGDYLKWAMRREAIEKLLRLGSREHARALCELSIVRLQLSLQWKLDGASEFAACLTIMDELGLQTEEEYGLMLLERGTSILERGTYIGQRYSAREALPLYIKGPGGVGQVQGRTSLLGADEGHGKEPSSHAAVAAGTSELSGGCPAW